MMYQKMERFEYTPEDVAIFRKQIREHIVPLCQKLYEEQKERLGIEELKYYDEVLPIRMEMQFRRERKKNFWKRREPCIMSFPKRQESSLIL